MNYGERYYMNNAEIRSKIFELHWEHLRHAHYDMRAGRVLVAMQSYERVLQHDMVHILYDYGCFRVCATEEPSLNWAGLYLIEYYIQRRAWEYWNALYRLILQDSDYASLPDFCKSRLISAHGWGQILHGKTGKNLYEQINEQRTALNELEISDFNKALHHMVLGQIYRQLRDEDRAVKHLQNAIELITLDEEPFYALLAREFIGDLYYFLNQKGPMYFTKAMDIYRETESLARHYGYGIDFTAQAYNLGWVYAEMDNMEKALFEFDRGYAEAKTALTEYEQAQYQYGLGYVYLMMGDRLRAIYNLENSLKFFVGESHIMSAACISLLVVIYERDGDTEMALDRIEDALANLTKADNPIQLHHALRRSALLNFRYGSKLRSTYHFIKMLRLRRSLGLKLWPI